MAKSKIYKIVGGILLLAIIGGGIWYATLTTRHKAIVKTTFLHKTGILDSNWDIKNESESYRMISPSFYIDGIYKSMEGPKSSNYVQLSQDSTLLYLTGFHVKAIDAKSGKTISNDFVCHTNVDFNDVKYFSQFHLDDRIGKRFPRMTSLSHGMENFKFPKGYGVPMIGNDLLFVTTQSLNHNLPDANLIVKHEVQIDYTKQRNLKPLMSRTAFVMLPYDKSDPYKQPLDPASNQCIPIETKNHSYEDGSGHVFSGHWVVPVGKNTYRSDVNAQLQIKDSLRLHASAIHVHPFATSITLFDKSEKRIIFKSEVVNHQNNIGLTKIEPFSSEEGIWLYADHDYEIVLTVDNTSKEQQDMMGSMFLFFYDAELEAILDKRK